MGPFVFSFPEFWVNGVVYPSFCLKAEDDCWGEAVIKVPQSR
jgi:hypothetical protein